ncbi:MAG TPA: Spy/CpxP family protein refolding chaperone [Bryobacteraceae bacterium]|nr:Spy/CpxP family protein refolding chaperone [Bryobacteraceae bacterium]
MTGRSIRVGTLLLFAAAGMLFAQGPRPFPSWWESPWWNTSVAQDLNLTDAQKNDINAIVKDYRAKMMDLRTAMGKADSDVEAAFGENPVDQRKANDAIEKLAAARGDLTRALSQMSLKLRTVLTVEQWQELERHSLAVRGPKGERGPRRGPDRRPPLLPPSSATKQ